MQDDGSSNIEAGTSNGEGSKEDGEGEEQEAETSAEENLQRKNPPAVRRPVFMQPKLGCRLQASIGGSL